MYYHFPEEKPWSMFCSGAQKEARKLQMNLLLLNMEESFIFSWKKQTHLAIHW